MVVNRVNRGLIQLKTRRGTEHGHGPSWAEPRGKLSSNVASQSLPSRSTLKALSHPTIKTLVDLFIVEPASIRGPYAWALP